LDNLTHTAIGLFLSRAGMKRWTPLATPIILLAANAPDVDIVTLSGGSLNYLHFHRHLTHSLIAMPVMAIASVALVKLVSRKSVNWLGAFFAALIAVASHLLLDLTNVYGIRLLLPFSGRWLSVDTTSVYDLWLWAAFFLCIAAPFLSKLVGSEIGSRTRPQRIHGRGFAWVALVFFAVYTGGRFVLHNRAIAQMESRLYDGARPVRTLAAPGAANPWRWRGVVETEGSFVVADVDLLGVFDPTRAPVYLKPAPDPALEAAMHLPEIREYLRFAQYPLWRVLAAPDVENGKIVQAVDLRFGTPAAPAFAVSVTLDAMLRPLNTSFSYGLSRGK
jgi:inner membrane protein